MAKIVRDAMTEDPRSIGSSASVVEAARLMRERHIGSLPVTEDERLVGMITDRDITTRVVAESAVPETTSVGDVYSRDLISVEPDHDLEEALELMARHQVRRLPVVENGRLVGMVAQADIALKDNERTGESSVRSPSPRRESAGRRRSAASRSASSALSIAPRRRSRPRRGLFLTPAAGVGRPQRDPRTPTAPVVGDLAVQDRASRRASNVPRATASTSFPEDPRGAYRGRPAGR